jgi:hypothetical protein
MATIHDRGVLERLGRGVLEPLVRTGAIRLTRAPPPMVMHAITIVAVSPCNMTWRPLPGAMRPHAAAAIVAERISRRGKDLL